MNNDDDMPELEDLSDQLQKKQTNNVDVGDYSKPINDKPIELKNPKKNDDDGFQGLKKGFFNQENDIIKPKEKKNPLEIDEVQEKMKQQNQQSEFGKFLTQNKDEWLNPQLLDKITKNPKLQKLFTNPEYLQAVQQMQHKPAEVMQKFKNNQEFIEIMGEYMKTMGEHFQQMQPKQQQQQQQQNQTQTQTQGQTKKIQEIKESKQQTQEERIQHIIETDQEVKQVLQDARVQAFIEYLQRTGKADFQEIAYKDPILMQKLQILIQKGVLNVQRM